MSSDLVKKFTEEKILFKSPDKNSDKRFVQHIENELDKLLVHLKLVGSKLIIAPTTLPDKIMNLDEETIMNLDDKKLFYRLRAIRISNETLRKFCINYDCCFDFVQR